jgi:hypothetical protein
MESIFWNEEWRDVIVANHPEVNTYKVSNYGRVKNTANNPDGDLMKQADIKGYKVVVLKLPNKKNMANYVHKLVATAFLENDDEFKTFVTHVDFNKGNNNVMNLKWVTPSESARHHRTNPSRSKRKVTNAKLTETQVKRIKKLLARNPKTRLKLIAKQFGITHTQLNRIRRGENWSHVSVD